MSYQKFFNPEESFSRSEIEAYQLERLKATVKHCMDSPFYKERFRQAGLTPSDIQTLDDLKKIPFTTKQDLRETYPFGMAAVPLDQCVRLHSSSGTTGNPTVILHRRTWKNGPMPSPAACGWWAAAPRTCSRTPPATGCSPVASASSTAPKRSAC